MARPERARSGHSVQFESITHRFGAATAVDGVSLAVEAGELVALLGPSGCGKTTLLRIIGGFLVPTAGSVRVDGRSIDHLPASRRDIGIVFQNYALFPHMTVYENVAYGLRARRATRALIGERVAQMLAAVQLEPLRDRLPRQLSGGQQQRVALARALAVEPRILLLDEPFGALDKNLRLDMQIEVKRLQRQFGITAILVTHDQEEAMSLADRIAVMNRGRVEQFASPVEVYDRPRTLFVNSFVGTANLLEGEIIVRERESVAVRLDAGATVDLAIEADTGASAGSGVGSDTAAREALAVGSGTAAGGALAVGSGTAAGGALAVGSGTAAGGALAVGVRRVVVSARPENLRLHARPGPGRWPVELRIRMPVGAQTVSEVVTRTGGSLKITELREAMAPSGEAGGTLYCEIASPSAVSIFAAPDAEPARLPGGPA